MLCIDIMILQELYCQNNLLNAKCPDNIIKRSLFAMSLSQVVKSNIAYDERILPPGIIEIIEDKRKVKCSQCEYLIPMTVSSKIYKKIKYKTDTITVYNWYCPQCIRVN